MQRALLALGHQCRRHAGAHLLEDGTLGLQPLLVGGVVDRVGVREALQLASLALGESLPVLVERADLERERVAGAHVLLELASEGAARLPDGALTLEIVGALDLQPGEMGGDALLQLLDARIVRVARCVPLLDATLLVDASISNRDAIVHRVDLAVERFPVRVIGRLPGGPLGIQRRDLSSDGGAIRLVARAKIRLPGLDLLRERRVIGLESLLEALHHHVVDGAVVDLLESRGSRRDEGGEADGAEQDGRIAPGMDHGGSKRGLPPGTRCYSVSVFDRRSSSPANRTELSLADAYAQF